MPDTGVFSGQPYKNAHFLNYSPIGVTDKWGESCQYIRLQLNYFIETLAKNIFCKILCERIGGIQFRDKCKPLSVNTKLVKYGDALE